MLNVPHTYSEWVEILEIFKTKSNDQEVIDVMQQGTLEWQSGVAERFARKLIDAVNFRMNTASDKFQRDMNHSHGNEGMIVQALLSLRKEMKFLSQAINLPVIPEKDRSQYVSMVLDQANNMQKSLEESARKERSGKLLSIVKNHKVNIF